MSTQDSSHSPLGSPTDPPGGSDALVRDGAWLQRLARRLVRDGQRADDAVQMTLIAAWKRGSSSSPPTRSWLARVLRNSLMQESRADARRARRQSEVVRSDSAESPQTTAERLELQRRILDTVESLDEPYRTTIVLRFLDDLSPRAIAARTETPVKTVHTRIERGLERLRARLDGAWSGDSRDNSDWRHALLAVPGVTSKTTTVLQGVLAMGLGIKIAGVAAVIAVVAGAALLIGPRDEVVQAETTELGLSVDSLEVLAAVPETSVTYTLSEIAQGVREASGTRSEAHSHGGPLAVVDGQFKGKVVDANEAPVADVRVTIGAGSNLLETKSDAAGQFVIDIPVPNTEDPDAPEIFMHGELPIFLVKVADPDWICLSAPHTYAETAHIIVAPRASATGRVVNASGDPLANAQVSLSYPPAVTYRQQGHGRHVFPMGATVETSEDGQFRIPEFAFAEGMTLVASKNGYVPGRADLDQLSTEGIELALARPVRGERGLEGRVTDAKGVPVEGAVVSAGWARTETDEEGWFLVDIPISGHVFTGDGIIRLWAVAAGQLPAQLIIDPNSPLPAFLELQLGGPSLTIAGHVEDSSGAAIPGAHVWVNTTNAMGSSMLPIEARIAPGGSGFGSFQVLTDARGDFELTGLLDKDYMLFAQDNSTLALAELSDVAAGSRNLRITISPSTPAIPISGRVLDRAGQAIPGVRVFAEAGSHEVPGSISTSKPYTDTDEHGNFAFPALVPDGLSLMVVGPNISSNSVFTMDTTSDLGALELVVSRTFRFRVESSDRAYSQGSFQVLDEAGEVLQMQRQSEGAFYISPGFQLFDGVSGVIQVDDSARTLVVRCAEREPVSIALDLETEGVTVVNVP